jgi:polysaccharide biosynthesis protein PslH
VSHLAKQHKVTVLALCANEREVAEIQIPKHEGITITPIQEKQIQRYVRCLRALGTQVPLQVAFGAAPQLRKAIASNLGSGDFDVLHMEALRTLGALPKMLPIPTVWDEVDCMSQAYELGTRFAATPLMRIIGQTETRRIRAFELLQLQRFHYVLVTSQRDRQALLDLNKDKSSHANGGANIAVIPHGIDQSYFQHYTGPRQPKTLIFSGTMSFHANIAGVVFLVKHILPLIWKQRPDVRLTIAGSNPPASVRRLERDPRIQVTGFVPDMRPYIAQAQVAVSPLPYATGIQNKILEAMALGTPVVTSSHGSAGLQAAPDQDLLVADDPQAFAASVLNLIDDHVLWNKLSEHGWAYIDTYHNWDNIVGQLISIYHHVIDAMKYSY